MGVQWLKLNNIIVNYLYFFIFKSLLAILQCEFLTFQQSLFAYCHCRTFLRLLVFSKVSATLSAEFLSRISISIVFHATKYFLFDKLFQKIYWKWWFWYQSLHTLKWQLFTETCTTRITINKDSTILNRFWWNFTQTDDLHMSTSTWQKISKIGHKLWIFY